MSQLLEMTRWVEQSQLAPALKAKLHRALVEIRQGRRSAINVAADFFEIIRLQHAEITAIREELSNRDIALDLDDEALEDADGEDALV